MEIESENLEEQIIQQARKKQKAQDFGGAINEYKKVLEINPSNTVAQASIEMLNQILNFYHKESYNP